MRGSSLHATLHHAGDGVDVLDVLARSSVGGGLDRTLGVELAAVAADADVDEFGVRPELGPDAAAPRLLGVGLEQLGAHGVDGGGGLRAHGLDLLVGDEAELRHLGGDTRNGVAVAPRGLLLLRAVAEGTAGVGAVLVEVAVDLGLDDRGTLSRAQVLLGLDHGEVHGEGVHAVDAVRADAESQAARREPRLGGDLVDVGRHGIQVVLDEERDRELPGRREVHALEHRADVGGPIAEVGDREVARAGMLLRPRVACRERHAAAHDGVRAEGARLEPLQVHGSATAAAVSLCEAEDLGERALQHDLEVVRDEVVEIEGAARDVGDRLGEELVVTAVRAVDAVARAQAHDRADRAALLADGRVRGSVHEAFPGELEHALLEGPDEVQLRRAWSPAASGRRPSSRRPWW